MESSIATFLLGQVACEHLPTIELHERDNIIKLVHSGAQCKRMLPNGHAALDNVPCQGNICGQLGKPSMSRLRAALEAAGWRPVELTLEPEGEYVEFRLERGPAVRHMDREQTVRRLITIFRGCGFEVGFREFGLEDFEDQYTFGMSLVGPLDQVCEHGPVPVEP